MRRSAIPFRLLLLAALTPVSLLASTIAAPSAGAAAPPSNCVTTGAFVRCTFAYNGTSGADGSAQRFVVPRGVRSITLEAWGAAGTDGPAAGGLGGHVRATFAAVRGTVLWVTVGGRGGFNGGGAGSAPGGGASDVRAGGIGLDTRVLVAGGGGGGGLAQFLAPSLNVILPLNGGAGGGPSGGGAICDFTPPGGTTAHIQGCGGGGTSIAGGAGGASSSSCLAPPTTVVPAQPGAAGTGGNGGTVACDQPFSQLATGAGGGGGYFGGGGGGAAVGVFPLTSIAGGGGGGSGYVRPGATDVTNEAGVRSGNGLVVVTYSHTPSSVFDCLHGGWRNLADDHGRPFSNVGQCVVWAFVHLR